MYSKHASIGNSYNAANLKIPFSSESTTTNVACERLFSSMCSVMNLHKMKVILTEISFHNHPTPYMHTEATILNNVYDITNMNTKRHTLYKIVFIKIPGSIVNNLIVITRSMLTTPRASIITNQF